MSVRTTRIAWALAAIAAGVAACESATNLDVSYKGTDAGSTDGTEPEGGVDAGEQPAVVLEGCPCDPTTGQGCCVTAKDAFCTDNAAVCAAEKGTLLNCAKNDPLTESACCWHGAGAGATTAYASTCDGGAPACLTNDDCKSIGVPCNKVTCAGFEFGACGAQPECPK